MTHVAFTPEEIKRWADFSGDYNPIHFDPDRARIAGVDGPVVHGMLALLPVKQLVSDRLLTPIGNDHWLRFKALFRAPVPQGCRQSIAITQNTAYSAKFSMRCTEAGRERCFGLASFGPLPDAGDIASAAPRHLMPLPAAADDFHFFRGDFYGLSRPWVWLDSLAFSIFIRRHLPNVVSEIGREPADFGPDAEISSGALVLQTSQESFVSPLIVGASTIDEVSPYLSALKYHVKKTAMAVTATEVCGSVQVSIRTADQVLLWSEYGLLMRKAVPATAHDAREN